MNILKANKYKIRGYSNQATLIMIIVGLQILYAGYNILKLLIAIVGISFKMLYDPLVLFGLGIFAAVIYVGICFFRGKASGWFGTVSLYTVLFIKNMLLLISVIFVLIFKESLLKGLHLPALNMNTSVLWAMVETIISVAVIKIMYSEDIIKSFKLDSNSGLGLKFKVSIIVVVTLAAYLGINFLITQK